MKFFSLPVAAVIMTVSCIALGDDATKDESQLDGVWLAKTAELNGKKFPDQAIANLKLTLKNGAYEVQAESLDRGTVTYDHSSKPKGMVIKGVEGPNEGKTILAIYELSGDTLKVCYDLSGKARPTEFKTQPKSQHFLISYERQKSGKAKAR